MISPVTCFHLSETLLDVIPTNISSSKVVFVCIGTDRSTGDSLGPLVGSFLKKKGYRNVIGTINNLVHAKNLNEKLREVPLNKKVIVIDSMLGKVDSIGKFYVFDGGLKPGAGVGKDLDAVGDYSITGVVNVGGFLSQQVLQYTELSLVLKMAEEITEAIEKRFPIPEWLKTSNEMNWRITS